MKIHLFARRGVRRLVNKLPFAIAALLMVTAACKEPPLKPVRLSDKERAELIGLLKDARESAEASDLARERLLRAWRSPVLGAEPCSIAAAHYISADQRPGDSSLISALLPRIELELPDRAAGAPPSKKTQRALDDWLVARPVSLDPALYPPQTGEQFVMAARRSIGDFQERKELLLRAREFTGPSAAGDSFAPGRIVGTLFVWDPVQKRLECGAPVDGTNSSSVSVSHVAGGPRPNIEGRLLSDLIVNTVFEPLHQLTQVTTGQ